MAGRPLREIVDEGWAAALEPVAGRIEAMGDFLRAEVAAGRRYLPAGDHVLRAFQQPFADVRVLIMGQDPYPTPGHPVGLSSRSLLRSSGCPRAWSTSSANITMISATRPRPMVISARGPNAA